MHRHQSDSEEWIKAEIQEADKSTYMGEGKKEGGWLKREVNIIRTVKPVKYASYEIIPFNNAAFWNPSLTLSSHLLFFQCTDATQVFNISCHSLGQQALICACAAQYKMSN